MKVDSDTGFPRAILGSCFIDEANQKDTGYGPNWAQGARHSSALPRLAVSKHISFTVQSKRGDRAP
jgi:hypothetical protein